MRERRRDGERDRPTETETERGGGKRERKRERTVGRAGGCFNIHDGPFIWASGHSTEVCTHT